MDTKAIAAVIVVFRFMRLINPVPPAYYFDIRSHWEEGAGERRLINSGAAFNKNLTAETDGEGDNLKSSIAYRSAPRDLRTLVLSSP